MKLTQNLRVKAVFSTALSLCVFAQRIFGGNLESSAIQTAKVGDVQKFTGCSTNVIGVQTVTLSNTLAVRAIIGEAAGEPFETKLAIAGALRNRGSLAGVRGLRNSKMIDVQPAWVWADARRAWSESATNDLSQGGTYFESTNFTTPFWARGRSPVATVGMFRFWKMEVVRWELAEK
jgi:spore germination cell wall hydrolase CwlJ-like protein